MFDGPTLHELWLVFGNLLETTRVYVTVELRVLLAYHHRGRSAARLNWLVNEVKLKHESQPYTDYTVCTHTLISILNANFSLQFFPKTAPVGGETELTLCGWEFQSLQPPSIVSGKTHVIQLGAETLCTVLPAKSNSEEWVPLLVILCNTQFTFSGFCVWSNGQCHLKANSAHQPMCCYPLSQMFLPLWA